jgi:hypothetical protein
MCRLSEIQKMYSPNPETDLLTEIETAIITRLDPLADLGLEIINSPQKNRVQRRAVAQVFFSGSADDRPGAEGKLAQARLNFSINLQLEDLRTHQPSYPFLMEIRSLLQGWSPAIGRRCGRLWQQGIDYQPYTQEEKLLWAYSATYALQLLY